MVYSFYCETFYFYLFTCPYFYINVDAVIEKNNLSRYYDIRVIDMEYFWFSSSDSTGESVKLAKDKAKGIAAQACAMRDGKKEQLLINGTGNPLTLWITEHVGYWRRRC